MNISEFMRDVLNFRKIMQINFYILSYISKCFYLWKRRVRKTKMSERRESLSKSLVMADPILNSALLNIRGQILLHNKIEFIPVELT